MPRQRYKLADGTVVPSVTTILGRFKDSGGLIYWAWQQGMDGKDYRETRDEAAAAGTLAHAMIEARIHDTTHEADPGTDPQVVEMALNAREQFDAWWSQHQIKLHTTEWRGVSERHRYGGTLDAIGEVGGELCLVDWKTSNGFYPDYLAQLAAYRELWNECNPASPIADLYYCCRFDKEHAEFAERKFSDLAPAWKYFLNCRESYELDKSLKAKLR